MCENALEETDISSVEGGRDGRSEVVNLGDEEGPGNFHVQGGHIYDEEQRRDGRALGDPYCDRGEDPRGPRKGKVTGAVPEKGPDQLYQLEAHTFA